MTRTKKRFPITVTHNPELPSPGQAANIALLVLAKAKKSNWGEMVADPGSHRDIDLTDDQRRLLMEHADLLPLLSRRPLVSIYSCADCGRFAFLDNGAAPASCNLTLGCRGRTAKSTTSAWKPKDLE